MSELNEMGCAGFADVAAELALGVNILADDQRVISEYYARPVEEQVEQESAARFDRTPHGTPVLHGALTYLECRLQWAHDAGDHTIFIAEVEDVVVRPGEPLLYFRGQYRRIGEARPIDIGR